MSDMTIAALFFGVIAAFWYCPACMAKGIVSLEGKPTTAEKILCAIPLFNIIYAEKRYYGKPKFCTITMLLLIVTIIARVFIWYNMYDNIQVGTISVFAFYGMILVFLIANALFVRTIISDAGVAGSGATWIYAIIIPYGQYYIGKFLVHAVRENTKKEATFLR